MAEFSPDMWVYWRDARGRILEKRLAALLPDLFEFSAPKRGRRS